MDPEQAFQGSVNSNTMRLSLPVDIPAPVNWGALREHREFLFRRVSDQGRAVLGVGVSEEAESPFFNKEGRVEDWWMGHLSYGSKDHLEDPGSRLPEEDDLPHARWWVPRWVVEWRGGKTWLHVRPGDEQQGVELVKTLCAHSSGGMAPTPAEWETRTDRRAYLDRAHMLMDHIRRGNIYEVNYCITREAHLPEQDPFVAFGQLLAVSDAPFAAFYRSGAHFALCASPERFLSFEGRRVVGQPMKGTRPRSADAVEDARSAAELAEDPKERSENIMALDVMRHDLSRIAASGTVRVEELCAVQSHRRVHQMVSTVSACLREDVTPWDAVLAAFPMASMTGAPKIAAMRYIDAVEDRPRGLFSGTLGFFAPDGTADLNVVIRTILFDMVTGRAMLSTGSALTAGCDPVREWEECELKARSVMDALRHA